MIALAVIIAIILLVVILVGLFYSTTNWLRIIAAVAALILFLMAVGVLRL